MGPLLKKNFKNMVLGEQIIYFKSWSSLRREATMKHAEWLALEM